MNAPKGYFDQASKGISLFRSCCKCPPEIRLFAPINPDEPANCSPMRIAILVFLVSWINAEAASPYVEELIKRANQGDSKAQVILGICYQFGQQGERVDFVAAVSWYTQAVRNKNADAMFNLGCCFEDGAGVKKDLIEAYAYFLLARTYNRTSGIRERLAELERKFSPSDVERGVARSKELYYLINPEEKEADMKRQQAEILQRVERQVAAAKEEAIRREAALKERAKQLDIIKANAAKADPDAEFKLGALYASGEEPGFPKDDRVAASWFLKAAMQGHAEAQYRVGLCYFSGRGVPKDVLQAYAFLDIAGNSLEEARQELSKIQKDMNDVQIIAGPKLSRELQKKIGANLAKNAGK